LERGRDSTRKIGPAIVDVRTGTKDHVDRLFLRTAPELTHLDSMDYSEL